MFLFLHNIALDLFIIRKEHTEKKISLSMLLVYLVLLSHLFHHIFLFLE
jgi:hypothetical protein